MLRDTKVRIFTNTQPGAPGVDLQHPGGLLELLDACLVAGFGSRTLDSGAMTRVGTTVTVAMGGHNHFDHSVLVIAGAEQTDYNGVHRIQVDDNDHFSFELNAAATPDSPATGTITAEVAPAGWTKPFAGTNKGVYRPADGPRHYLRVDDAWKPFKAIVRAYQSMTDVDTGLGAYPNATVAPNNACCWMKPLHGEWWIVADDKGMHLIVSGNPNYDEQCSYYFGWFKDLYQDASACSLLSVGSYNLFWNNNSDDNLEQTAYLWNGRYITNNNPAARVDQCSGYLAKSFDGVQDCVAFGFIGYAVKQQNTDENCTFNDQTTFPYAATRFLGNIAGNGLASQLRGFTLQPPFVYEPSYAGGTTQLRGMLPFLQCVGLYPATARHRLVARYDERFGAILSLLRKELWGAGSLIPRASIIPLGNWEDVL